MRLSTGLIRVSTVLFAVIGLGYLVAPSAMPSIVGIDAEPTADFLMRTEGVALLHDLSRPVEVLRAARDLLVADGALIVVDELSADAFLGIALDNPVERFL